MEGKGKGRMVEEDAEDEEKEGTDGEAEWREEVMGKLKGLEETSARILAELVDLRKKESARFEWVKAIHEELEGDREDRMKLEVEVKKGLKRLQEYLDRETEESEEPEGEKLVDVSAEEAGDASEESGSSEEEDVEMKET